MKKSLTEESILFISILKWFVLASTAGVVVGISTTIFLKVLHWCTEITARYPYYFLLLPLALFLSAAMIKYLAPDAEGHWTEKVIEAVHRYSGRIKAMVVPVKLVATVVTLSAGGSVGKEGPCAQIGAGLTSILSDLLRFDDQDRKKLVICGISAGFATVFGTPIAGAIFGIEVLFVGSILYDVIMPSFVAGIIGYQVATAFGVTYFHHPIDFVTVFSESFFVTVALAGVFFGFCSFLLIELMKSGEELSERMKLPQPLKALAGGVILILLTLLFSERYLGLGLDTIQATLQGERIPWYAFLVKAVFTSITLNMGGSGGILTPIFFIGAAAGSLFAVIFGLNIATFSAIGLVSLLAGAANTPIAASIMAVELFGPTIAPYAAVACVISFLMTGHRSVYPSQVLAFKKSSSIHVELGEEVERIEPRYKPRRKSLTGVILSLARVLKEWITERKRGGGSGAGK